MSRPHWQLQALGLLAALLSCALVTGVLITFGGPALLVRWRGDAVLTGTLLDAAGRPWSHQPVALIVQQPDGRAYRAAAATDGAGGLRLTVPANALRPGPVTARLEAAGPDGRTWSVPVPDLRGGQTRRGSWQPKRP